jgi:peptide deformylase
MTKPLPLITYPNPLLKQISKPVEQINESIRQLVEQMFVTMYREGGIGLAAVQVGVLLRVIVCDLSYEIKHHHHSGPCNHDLQIINSSKKCFINPVITDFSQEKSICKEGCLSFPNLRADVSRPKTVTVSYLDIDGKQCIEQLTDLDATCIQHEIDHLNGIVFVDYLSKIKQKMLLNKLKKHG